MALVTILVAGLVVYFAMPELSASSKSDPSTSTTALKANSRFNIPRGTTVQVVITDTGYEPPSMKVVIGVNNTVTWINRGSETHSVTAITGKSQVGMIDSQDWVQLTHGNSWNYTFTSPGIFYYDCVYHGGMQGEITVESPSGLLMP